MAEPFLAEIRMVGFNFAPRGWALCDGQILPINQNQSLYSLLGTAYGGDGRTSFALPDLRGRTPIHVGTSNNGTNHPQGQKGGEEAHTLSTSELPPHKHPVMATTARADAEDPSDLLPGVAALKTYRAPQTLVNMASETVAIAGGGQSHQNMQPFLAVNFAIAIQGLFPPRN